MHGQRHEPNSQDAASTSPIFANFANALRPLRSRSFTAKYAKENRKGRKAKLSCRK